LAAADKQKAFLLFLIQNIARSETPIWTEAPGKEGGFVGLMG
jgi:hypothetical protein